jgi:hypothetical protein
MMPFNSLFLAGTACERLTRADFRLPAAKI